VPGSVRSDSPNDDVEVFACFRTLNLPSSLGWGGRKRPPHHSFVVEVPGSVGSPSATLLPIPDATPPTMTMTQGITPGSSSLWRCRESNPGPCRPIPVFYVCSHAVATRPPRFVWHCAVTAQSLFGFPPAPVTGAIGESPSDARPRLGDASGWRLI